MFEGEHLDHLNYDGLGLGEVIGNLKKYTFFTEEVIFVGYIVTKEGFKVDEGKGHSYLACSNEHT